MGNCHEPGNLIHQINEHHCVWSHCGNGVTNLRFQIPEFLLGLTSSFKIIGILPRSNLNGSGSKKWYVEVKLDNKQILTLKIICLGYRLPSYLGPKNTCCLLKFIAEKSDVLRLLSMFDTQKELDFYLLLVTLRKYLFIT